jgi:hypothetical protein
LFAKIELLINESSRHRNGQFEERSMLSASAVFMGHRVWSLKRGQNETADVVLILIAIQGDPG